MIRLNSFGRTTLDFTMSTSLLTRTLLVLSIPQTPIPCATLDLVTFVSALRIEGSRNIAGK